MSGWNFHFSFLFQTPFHRLAEMCPGLRGVGVPEMSLSLSLCLWSLCCSHTASPRDVGTPRSMSPPGFSGPTGGGRACALFFLSLCYCSNISRLWQIRASEVLPGAGRWKVRSQNFMTRSLIAPVYWLWDVFGDQDPGSKGEMVESRLTV